MQNDRHMILFLDTEFTGLDQDKPDLISIALVDEKGREFYAELPTSHYAVQCNEWVHFNVLPHLWGGDHVLSVVDIVTAHFGIEAKSVTIGWNRRSRSAGIVFLSNPDVEWQDIMAPHWEQTQKRMPDHERVSQTSHCLLSRYKMCNLSSFHEFLFYSRGCGPLLNGNFFRLDSCKKMRSRLCLILVPLNLEIRYTRPEAFD